MMDDYCGYSSPSKTQQCGFRCTLQADVIIVLAEDAWQDPGIWLWHWTLLSFRCGTRPAFGVEKKGSRQLPRVAVAVAVAACEREPLSWRALTACRCLFSVLLTRTRTACV